MSFYQTVSFMTNFKAISILCLLLFQSVVQADSGLWTGINQSLRSATTTDLKDAGWLYRVDPVKLKQLLFRASFEGRSEVTSEIELPVTTGEIQRFKLEESPIMAPELAAKYPEIKTYKVHGIDNPAAGGRLSISPKGFHAMISDPSGTFYIDPESGDTYKAYSKKSQVHPEPFKCGVEGHNHLAPLGTTASRPAYRTAGSLRVYRLAVATTGEYVEAIGDVDGDLDIDKDDAIVEIINAINRVDQIYERDLGVRLVLIGQNTDIVYTNKFTDPYTDPYSNTDTCAINNTCASTADLLEQNQTNINSVIGLDNYDIGHVFSRGGGGLAEVGSVCRDSVKAGGVTGLPNPTGDSFYIDFVAHEIGHQFSAEHSFNGTTSSCAAPNRWQASAFEPGGGSTIMSYAGICKSENIVNNADAVFHAGSIDYIDSFTTSGSGSNCGELLNISNPNEPVVDAGNDYTIPRKTPFILTATGEDGDPDSLTYTWDQMDAGTATTSSTLGTDLGNNSLFRSYLPRSEHTRHFPALGTTLQNKYDDSENLACLSRSINFRVTVRDGKSGIGKDNVRLSVDNGSGPFRITSFNQSQSLSPGNYDINWDVANTDKTPVNCSLIDISLLTFKFLKTSYSETPLARTDNDGSATVTIGNILNSRARFKIQCSDNIFYDISDADLTFTGGIALSTTGNKVDYNSAGLLMHDTPTESCITGDVAENPTTDSSSGGGGTLNLYWLISLFTLLSIRRRKSPSGEKEVIR